MIPTFAKLIENAAGVVTVSDYAVRLLQERFAFDSAKIRRQFVRRSAVFGIRFDDTLSNGFKSFAVKSSGRRGLPIVSRR